MWRGGGGRARDVGGVQDGGKHHGSDGGVLRQSNTTNKTRQDVEQHLTRPSSTGMKVGLSRNQMVFDNVLQKVPRRG